MATTTANTSPTTSMRQIAAAIASKPPWHIETVVVAAWEGFLSSNSSKSSEINVFFLHLYMSEISSK